MLAAAHSGQATQELQRFREEERHHVMTGNSWFGSVKLAELAKLLQSATKDETPMFRGCLLDGLHLKCWLSVLVEHGHGPCVRLDKLMVEKGDVAGRECVCVNQAHRGFWPCVLQEPLSQMEGHHEKKGQRS